jgi:hypothetical protein
MTQVVPVSMTSTGLPQFETVRFVRVEDGTQTILSFPLSDIFSPSCAAPSGPLSLNQAEYCRMTKQPEMMEQP